MSAESTMQSDQGAGAALQTTPTPAQASAQLEQLRMDRLAGKVLEHDYLERADYLARLVAGEQASQPSAPATLAERFAQQYEQAMAVPKSPHEYGSLPPMSNDPERAYEIDGAVRSAFMAGGVPAVYANQIAQNALRVSKFPAADVHLNLRNTAEQLQRAWGDQFAQRKAAIDEVVLRMAEADERIGALIDAAPELIYADPFTMELLDRVAQHKARHRA